MRKWGPSPFIGLYLFFRLAQFEELRVLHVAVDAADGDVQKAWHAVEEAQAQDIELEEAHDRREEEPQDAGAAAELVRLARGERGVAVLPVEVGGEIVGGVVQEIARERPRRHRVEHLLV